MTDNVLQIEETYINGECGAFAYALWVALGRPSEGMIGILSDDNNEPFSGDIPFDCTHAYLDMPNGEFDVKGKRELIEMVDDLHIEALSMLGPYDPVEFLKRFTTHGSEDRPLVVSDDSIEKALEFIHSNPGKYGLPAFCQ